MPVKSARPKDVQARRRTSLLAFFLLVFALTLPFLALDALGGTQILPGIPLAGLAFVCPAVAAVVLRYRENGSAGVRALLARAFDGRRTVAKVWYLPTLLLYPAVVVASFLLLRLTGAVVPEPRISPVPALLLVLGFFVSGLCEELGWSGYATGPLRERWGALTAALVLGSVWAVWHWMPLLQVGRSPSWIAWWSLNTLAARVIMVWLFDRVGRSVLAMALFHMTLNVAWQLSPVDGSHFDMPLVATLMAAVAVTVVAAEAVTSVRRGSLS